MSKAFTKEGDDGDSDPLTRADLWPEGVKNYITPAEHAELKARIAGLRALPPVTGRKKLEREQKLAALLSRLEAAEVVEPRRQPEDVVRFGARVTVEDADGNMSELRIVSVDAAAPARGLVSWRSPFGAALLGRRVEDNVQVPTPGGVQEMFIVSISYE